MRYNFLLWALARLHGDLFFREDPQIKLSHTEGCGHVAA